MKSFREWRLFLEGGLADDPELNKVQVMGWSLSTGTLPPWSYEHDQGLDPTSVFEGRSGPGKGGWEVYQASKHFRKDRNGDKILNYLKDNIRVFRATVRSGDPNRIRNLQYNYMTGKQLKYGENAPEDFVAPDAGGGPQGYESGSHPNGKTTQSGNSKVQLGNNSQNQQQSQPQQSDSKVVKCPHCGAQFKT